MTSPMNTQQWTHPPTSHPKEPMKEKITSPTEGSSTCENDENMSSIISIPTYSHPPGGDAPNYISWSMRFEPEIKMSSSLMVQTTGNPNSPMNSNSEGVLLTWQDLWVTVPSGGKDYKPLLQGLFGYAQSGETLAIMGPSGCGKSALLDALAGRLDSNTRQSGEILVNGRRQLLAFGTSAYVTQDDALMTTLTVKEAVTYSAYLQLPNSMTINEKKERAEMTIREMGLQDSMNTRIGGWNTKGLSGGQKRRVSICIEILTCPKLLFLDEPTSGLDSAASFHVVNTIVRLSKQYGMTVLASIHQPSTEAFDLFHNLCLLSSGRTIYFGPRSSANQFFALNGFPCPNMRNPSDHYLRTINKDFDQDIEQGFSGKPTSTEEAIDSLIKSYKSSQTSQQVQLRITEICQREGELLWKKSQSSFITQCLVLTRRSSVNMYRDVGYYWLRIAIYVALCLCIGMLFRDIGHSYRSIQARGAVLMFIAAFLTFMAIGGFPSFVEEMKIFGRERLNGHYGVAAFAIGNTISSIPYLLLISLVPGAIAYYIVGLHKGVDHFFFYALLIFMCMTLVESLMMVVASIVPNFLMGIITGAGIQGVMLLNGGFFRLPNDIPKPFWKYPFYYISFHRWANEGLYKNEFEGLTFPNDQGIGVISGEEILKNQWEMDMSYSKWVDVVVLFGMVVLYRLIFFSIIKMSEKIRPLIRALLANPSKKGKQIMEDSSSSTLSQ